MENTFPMNTTSELLEKIEAALQSVSYPTRPEGLYEPIKYVLSAGGKRIRPMLVLLCYGLYRDDVEKALPVAIGLETYHNHTLLHDDLMDNADMRRGRPTVHKRWNENTAILSGDAMLITAFHHLLSCQCDHPDDILNLAARTMLEICEGQQYDVNFESRDDVSEAEYIEMIRLKTSVLLACAAKAGALAADAPQEEADALYTFAERIGLAFQLQDDFLDVYGDPEVFGKKTGGDILCGKKTFLLINAFNRADEGQRELLHSLINDKDMDEEEKISAVTALYNELGIPGICLQAIEDFYVEALHCLDKVHVAEEKKTLLRQFAESLSGRKS